MKLYRRATEKQIIEKFPVGEWIGLFDTVLLYNGIYATKDGACVVGMFDLPLNTWSSTWICIIAETEEEQKRLIDAYYKLEGRNDSYEDGCAILSKEEFCEIVGKNNEKLFSVYKW
jgi:hypothetical protein